MQSPIGGTLAYGDGHATDRRPCQQTALPRRVVQFQRLIPVYPKEITRTELRAKTGFSEGQISSLISSVSNHYLLCQDGDRFSLLRRGRADVD